MSIYCGHSNSCPSTDVPNNSFNDVVPNDNVEMSHEMDASNEQPTMIKDDMRPWMLMNYRNKKKNSKVGDQTKSPSKGYRFSVLQDINVAADNEAETIADIHTNSSTPPIVKLWTNFQDKLKNVPKPSEPANSKPSSSLSKSSKPPSKTVNPMHLSVCTS